MRRFAMLMTGIALLAAPAFAQTTAPQTPRAAPGQLVPLEKPTVQPPAPVVPMQASVGYTSEDEARKRCGADPVVWINSETKIYHVEGGRWYGKTKAGAYQCTKVAQANGARAALNEEKAPPPPATGAPGTGTLRR